MCDDCDEDEGMDPKTFRTVVICVASVVVALIVGCTIAAVASPREWACVMNGYRYCDNADTGNR